MRSNMKYGAALAVATSLAAFALAGSLQAEETKAPAPKQGQGAGRGAGHGPGHGGGQGAGRGRGPWRGGRGADAQFEADRELFHFLLSNHESIRRTVKKLDNGVQTVTESDDANVALAIQGHVASMRRRVEKVQPIHMRDPLFRALFGNAAKIVMKVEKTEKGVRVVETSEDPYVAKLIQAHAEVVSLFAAKGHEEVRKNHDVPKPTTAGD